MRFLTFTACFVVAQLALVQGQQIYDIVSLVNLSVARIMFLIDVYIVANYLGPHRTVFRR